MQEIKRIHHTELYVSNSKHSAHFYCYALGFKIVAYGDPSTGLDDRVSYVLQQGSCYIILTSPLYAESEIKKYLDTHGDGVCDVCFVVENAKDLQSQLEAKDVKFTPAACASYFIENSLSIFTIKAFGDVTNSFISQTDLSQHGLAQLKNCFKYVEPGADQGKMISHIDHIALCGPIGFIDKMKDFYCLTLGFVVSRIENITSQAGGMKTIVLESSGAVVKIPVVEPLENDKKSALDKFLTYNNGEGVHHIAFYTNNIINAVVETCKRGVEYMQNGNEYYDLLQQKFGTTLPVDLNKIKNLNILCDINEQGYLLQIFSQPTQPQPTFFFELIERQNNQGFGSGNIKALYDSINP